MHIADCIELYLANDVKGAWTREAEQALRAGGPGSGRHPGGGAQTYMGSGTAFYGYHHHTSGEDRQYHILQGAGPNGGQWAAHEANRSGGTRELAVFDSMKEAEEHVHLSQH